MGQLDDMVRLHLAARPFMRYSVHLSLCGDISNLAIVDRAGGVVSKEYKYNIIADIHQRGHTSTRTWRRSSESFVRLGRDLDVYDMGLDWTAVSFHSLGSWK